MFLYFVIRHFYVVIFQELVVVFSAGFRYGDQSMLTSLDDLQRVIAANNGWRERERQRETETERGVFAECILSPWLDNDDDDASYFSVKIIYFFSSFRSIKQKHE